jgi:thioredoxin-related protein
MKNRLPLTLVFSCLCFITFFNPKAFAQINWLQNFQQAYSITQNSNKPLLIYMFNTKAQNCIRYHQETFLNKAVIDLFNEKYVALAVNVEQDRATASRFGVFRVPCILIVDKNGEEYLRLVTFYPADKLVETLVQTKRRDNSSEYLPAPENASLQNVPVILGEPFESIFGWGNDNSTEGCTAQIGLVQGIQGNAFRIDYELIPGKWNYIQVHKTLSHKEPIKLPEDFTLVFHLAGIGGKNKLNIKFADSDGTNYGAILSIPTDNKAHKVTLTSDEVKYLWGGNDQVLENIEVLLVAVTPYDIEKQTDPRELKGTVYIDELQIFSGKPNNDPLFQMSRN